MGVSQPAVSQTIARLEELLGGDLFERKRGAPVALTPIGRAILPKAKLLLFTVDQQIERALATAQSYSGTLNVGFYIGLALGPLSQGIADFRGSTSTIELRIVEGSPSELYRQLNERSLDIIFTAYAAETGNGLNQRELVWEEAIIVAVRSDHPFSSRSGLSWQDLVSLPLLMRSHGGDLTAYRVIASRMGDLPFNCELHDVSRGALIEMVRLGMGAAISFASAVVPRESVTFLPVIGDNSQVAIYAAWPRDDRNPLRHRLLSLVRKHAASR